MTKPPKIAKARGRADLTADDLRRHLTYDPATGIFRRVQSTAWNAMAGEVAGTMHVTGYIYIRIGDRDYKAQRLAWLYMTGEWPTLFVDHINGDGFDNKWDNLREASHRQNAANARIRKDNKTGHKGIREMNGRWQVRLGRGGSIHVGTFDDIKDAIEARDNSAKIAYGDYWRAK